MTASEKLQGLIENNKLTDSQLDNVNDWGIQRVSDLEDYLIDSLADSGYIDYKEAVTTLYNLLNYNEDDFVIYDEKGVTILDFDTLDDALDVD